MKHLKRVLFFIAVCLIAATAVNAKPAQAATAFKRINAVTYEPQTVGTATFTCKGGQGDPIHYYVTINGKKKELTVMSKAQPFFVTNGSTIYYNVNTASKVYFYRTTVNNTLPVKIKTISSTSVANGAYIWGYYNYKIYYRKGNNNATFYSYNVKTGEIAKITSGMGQAEQQGKYFYLNPYPDYHEPWVERIYNASTGAMTRLCSETYYFKSTSSYLYYARVLKKVDADTRQVRIYRSKLDGSGKTVLVSSVNVTYIENVTNTKMQYYAYNSKGEVVFKTLKF